MLHLSLPNPIKTQRPKKTPNPTSLFLPLSHRPLNLPNALPTSSPASTASLTFSSAATKPDNKAITSPTCSRGITTTPLIGSAKTRSFGSIIVPWIFRDVWRLCACALWLEPTVDVDFVRIWVWLDCLVGERNVLS